MRIVLQRVKEASVTAVDPPGTASRVVGRIGPGLLLLVGFHKDDGEEKIDRLAKKTAALRIFEDGRGKMNLSVEDTGGKILAVSQFTLYGDTRKGRRPGFSESMEPGKAERMYELFIERLRGRGITVETGIFGAKMEVALVNDGPVTFILEE
jgi:D-tyrosyl-tRNA(Tyr) deacylase